MVFGFLRRRRTPRQLLGSRGQRLAERFLRRKGLRVVLRNYQCQAGEVDLICRDDRSIVFVEVKTRHAGSNDDRNELLFGVSIHQQRRIHRAGRLFMRTAACSDMPCRCDLVTVRISDTDKPVIEHFVNAF